VIAPLETSSDPKISLAVSELLASVGKSYSSDYIEALLHLGYVVVAIENSSVVGVITAMQLLASDAEQMRERIEGLDISTDPVALPLHDMVIDPAWRRRGIATELLLFVLRCANYGESAHRFTRALATSRMPPTGETSGTSLHLLERLSFQEMGRFPAGYYHESPGWRCPDCGEHCRCGGRLMLWQRADD
jgi:GNAT superfamily N-acetyltransferase